MSRRSPEFWLRVLGVALALCLAAVAYGNARYAKAEAAYESHLQRVVIRPHVDIKAELAGYAQNADHWLRVRTAASAATAIVVGGVLVQVVRRRSARLANETVEEETDA